MKDKYEEIFGQKRPSQLYNESQRIEWIVSETDAERINARWASANIMAGEKGTQLPPPETNEKAWERLVKGKAQRVFENLQIKLYEKYSEPESKEVLQAHLDKINQFVSEAENSNLIDAIEKPDFQSKEQEYLRIKHKYYNKNFCGSKDGWSIPGRTPIEPIIAGVYGEYFLFKNWLEQLLKEQIDNNEQATFKQQEQNPLPPQQNGIELNKEPENDVTLATIEDWLFEFKDKMTENDYNRLVSALKHYFEKGKFPEIEGEIKVKRVNKKLFGWHLNRIFYSEGKGIDIALLQFAKQYISLFKDVKFDINNVKKSNLYKYFTSKTK